MTHALEHDGESNRPTQRTRPAAEPDETCEEKEEAKATSTRTEVTNEYRNVRAIHGSERYITEATANGHTPNLYFLTETWWQT